MRRALLSVAPWAVLAGCLYLVDLPIWVESPGGARSVLPLIAIDGAPTYDSNGRLLLTTVNVGRANLYYALRAWLDPAAFVLSEQDVLPPGQTDEEYERLSLSQMDQSKIAGVAVALQHATDYPREHGPGAIVQDVVPGSPADGRLFAGDLITEIEGEPLADLDQLGRVIRYAGERRTIRLRVRPLEGGESRDVSVQTVFDERQQTPIIGIFPVANFPFDVEIESGSIGGPSAGLMWALGVTDLLTSLDLTGDRVVAGTGTVGLDGDVGPIGGIGLKVVAAERAGADTFLLPQENLAEARAADTDLTLVSVLNVEQAIAYLEDAA
jgi:PDZ domain-containing protein